MSRVGSCESFRGARSQGKTSRMNKCHRTLRSAHAAGQALLVACLLGSRLGATEVGAGSITWPQRGQLPFDTATATTIRLERPGSVDLSAYFTESDGQNLRYTAQAVDSALVAVTMSGSNLAVSTPATETVYVQVRATNLQGRTVARVFRVIVARPREPLGDIGRRRFRRRRDRPPVRPRRPHVPSASSSALRHTLPRRTSR